MHLVRCVGIDSKSMPALNSIRGAYRQYKLHTDIILFF